MCSWNVVIANLLFETKSEEFCIRSTRLSFFFDDTVCEAKWPIRFSWLVVGRYESFLKRKHLIKGQESATERLRGEKQAMG